MIPWFIWFWEFWGLVGPSFQRQDKKCSDGMAKTSDLLVSWYLPSSPVRGRHVVSSRLSWYTQLAPIQRDISMAHLLRAMLFGWVYHLAMRPIFCGLIEAHLNKESERSHLLKERIYAGIYIPVYLYDPICNYMKSLIWIKPFSLLCPFEGSSPFCIARLTIL